MTDDFIIPFAVKVKMVVVNGTDEESVFGIGIEKIEQVTVVRYSVARSDGEYEIFNVQTIVMIMPVYGNNFGHYFIQHFKA